MIIMGLADIHGGCDAIRRVGKELGEADVVLMAGDITHFGGEAQALEVLGAIFPVSKKVLAVSGNCDYPEVDAYLESRGINLHGNVEVHGGVCFVGLGGSLITPFHTPNEYTEGEIRGFLSRGASMLPPGLPLFLVSHQPPLNTSCDRLSSGQHVGSAAVREFIETHQPAACICGHIHESRNVDRIGDTWIINPGMLGKGHYAYVRIGEGEERFEVKRFIQNYPDDETP